MRIFLKSEIHAYFMLFIPIFSPTFEKTEYFLKLLSNSVKTNYKGVKEYDESIYEGFRTFWLFDYPINCEKPVILRKKRSLTGKTIFFQKTNKIF